MISGIILDTNIVISAMIKPEGAVATFMYTELMNIQLMAPGYLFHEILSKEKKILDMTNYSGEEFHELLQILSKRITWVDMGLIEDINVNIANDLVSDIDPKDYAFIALSLQTGNPVWSGDLQLTNGLRKKGFNNIYNTEQLRKQLGIIF